MNGEEKQISIGNNDSSPSKPKKSMQLSKVLISSVINSERAIHSRKDVESSKRPATRDSPSSNFLNLSSGFNSRVASSEKKFHRKGQSLDKKQLEFYKRKLLGNDQSSILTDSEKKASHLGSDKITGGGSKTAIISSLMASMNKGYSNSRFINFYKEGNHFPEVKNMPNISEYKPEIEKCKVF
jgi:hypothetical protein